MKHWLRPVSKRAIMSVLTAGLTFSFVGLAAGASTAPSSSPQRFGYSSALCAWLQLHSDRARGLTCPASGPMSNDAALNNRAAPSSRQNSALDQSRDAGSRSDAPTFNGNVDATNFNEDLASGQSETAIGALGRYVATAWNDATGFIITDSTNPQGSLTSVGFSSDGGKTFTDVLLPNDDPCQRIFGDPSVVAYKGNGTTYFYVTSLYLPEFSALCPNGGNYKISMSVGTVSGTNIVFDPHQVVVADGGNFQNPPISIKGFLDKDFAAIDRSRGKIVVSYTCFGAGGSATDACGPSDVEISLCTLENPAHPFCRPPGGASGPTYMTLATAPLSPAGGLEELEGAYPAFNPSGDSYVTWNQNWSTNYFDGDPLTHQMATKVPASCLKGTPCGPQPIATVEGAIKSLDTTTIPGYNRGTGQEFPRIAYNSVTNKVVFVWNEGNAHPLGDIVMKTADPTLTSFGAKIRVNDDHSFALHFLPAVSVDASGNTNVSWYDRRNAGGTAFTDVYAASIGPGQEGGKNARVTTVATEWNDTGSFVTPNFGDYTDNTSEGNTFYVSWSDGRIGVPNAFVASAQTGGGNQGQ
jgi:hypothetical protein